MRFSAKKLAATVLSATMIASVLGGCGGVARKTVEIDSNRTTLTIGNFNGGVGTEWLNSAIKKFEEKYKDTSFEEGKKGVQVIIGSNNKTTMEGETLKDVILNDETRDEIFFTEGVFYQWWAKSGKMLDITEYVNADLTEFGEEKSIASKINEDNLKALQIDGKIYAIPFWQGNYCMVYNATLFDENKWYLGADGQFTDAKGKLSAGADGKEGTYDDGMPATYDEFYQLLAEIKKDNCVPIQFPGASQDYVSWFLSELAADNMGYEQFMLNYNFNGTAELIKEGTLDWNTMKYDTEKVKITQKNAYELARQPGIAQAVKFAETILQDQSNYDINKSLSGSFKIAQSQLEFVRNPTVSAQKNVAIMFDGYWWENEAANAFKETYGTKATKYDADMEYKVMPMPKATKADIGKENIVVESMDSYCFIKSNIAPEKIDVATKFVQFVHTDAQMEEFTQITGLLKPYEYEVNTEELTSFSKSMIEYVNSARIALPTDSNDLYSYSPSDFRLVRFMKTKYASDRDASDMTTDVLTTKSGGKYVYSAKEYYAGVLNYRKNVLWKNFDKVLK